MVCVPIHQIGILTGREIIGDALIKLPFLRALRAAWPTAKIHWITTQDKTAYSGPLRETIRPLLDEIHETPSWLKLPDDPETPDFDLLIDTRGRWKLALEARLSLPHKIFIAPAFRYLFSDKRPSLLTPRPKRLIDRLLQTVELAAGYLPDVSKRLPVSPDLLEKARRILPEGPVYVGFAVGAGNAIKKWPLENFEKVAQHQARLEHVPVFLLGPQEMDLYDRLFQAVPEAIFPLQAYDVWETDKPQVDQTLAIAACLDAALTNDSGTSHMLAAVDCPLVSLFGPTRASKLAPKVTLGRTICAQEFGSESMEVIPYKVALDTLNQVFLLQNKV